MEQDDIIYTKKYKTPLIPKYRLLSTDGSLIGIGAITSNKSLVHVSIEDLDLTDIELNELQTSIKPGVAVEEKKPVADNDVVANKWLKKIESTPITPTVGELIEQTMAVSQKIVDLNKKMSDITAVASAQVDTIIAENTEFTPALSEAAPGAAVPAKRRGRPPKVAPVTDEGNTPIEAAEADPAPITTVAEAYTPPAETVVKKKRGRPVGWRKPVVPVVAPVTPVAEVVEPKKRGRKPKAEKAAINSDKPVERKSQEYIDPGMQNDTPTRKKRGPNKPKAEKPVAKKRGPKPKVVDAPKKRGRPAKAPVEAPKRRGRPAGSKNKIKK